MRPIKFRLWDKENKKIQYQDHDRKTWYFDDEYDCIHFPLDVVGYMSYKDEDNAVLMQFTGVRDKNNKDIYEGDIVFVTHMLVETIPTYKAVVEWDKCRFALRNLDINNNKFNMIAHGAFGFTPYNDLNPFGLSLEIVGNIYENPEKL